MELLIAVEEDDGRPRHEELYDWLRAEPGLRPYVRRDSGPHREGELNTGVLGLLAVAIGSGGTLSVLAGTLGTWLSQARNRRLRVRIDVKNGRVRSIQLDADNARATDIERILRSVCDAEARDDGTG